MSDLVSRIRALLAAATPGPWERDADFFGDHDCIDITVTAASFRAPGNLPPLWLANTEVKNEGPDSGCWERARETQEWHDAALIAAAPTLLAEAAGEIERMRRSEIDLKARAVAEIGRRVQCEKHWHTEYMKVSGLVAHYKRALQEIQNMLAFTSEAAQAKRIATEALK